MEQGKKPTNGEAEKMAQSLDEKEAEEILEDPLVRDILKKKGKC